MLDLVRRGDVLIENFKPGTMDDLGLGWETLRAVNPRLIYCAISGFGATGPYRERAGYDAILQGFTGLMSITGESDGAPVKVGVALIDAITALYAHGAILAALRHRERTGQGQYLELSLMECGIAALINAATGYLVGGEVQGRWGSAHPSLVPYQAFRARDGYLMVGAGNERLWKAFCEVLGTPEWADDPATDRTPGGWLPGGAGAGDRGAAPGTGPGRMGRPLRRRPGSRRGRSTTSARCSTIRRCVTGRWWSRSIIRRRDGSGCPASR